MSIADTNRAQSGTRAEERGRGVGGWKSPHDAQRTNGAADSSHMSINPLRSLNASLPFHYSTPSRCPRSPPPRHFHFPFASPRTSTPVTLPGGGAELRRLTHLPSPPPPPSSLCALLLQVPSRCGVDEQLRTSWPQPAALYPLHSIKMWLGN